MKWCRVDPTALSTILWTDTKYSFHRCSSSLAWIKQFAKALDKDGSCFSYLSHVFSGLSIEKLKGGIFDGRQVRQLIRDPEFEKSMTKLKSKAWKPFVLVVKNFLGNNKASNYEELITNILYAFKNLGCNMSIKMHHLFSHIDRFPENLGTMSDEQGERFHRNIKEMETSYQGRWNAAMMADYCWTLKRDILSAEHSRISKKGKFIS